MAKATFDKSLDPSVKTDGKIQPKQPVMVQQPVICGAVPVFYSHECTFDTDELVRMDDYWNCGITAANQKGI